MMRGRLFGAFVLFLSVSGLLPSEASAAFHLMKVVEVFPGTEAAPNAQYVVIQMYAAGQNLVAGHHITVYDASDRVLGTFTFASSVANGANQDTILIATPEAATFFGVTADLAMTAVLPRDGGRVCFDAIPEDCLTWGDHPTAPFSPAAGLPLGLAVGRRLDVAGGATTLEAADDTNDSANDFRFRAPSPRNNARVTGSAPAATCGDGARAGLESCDDGNTIDDATCPGTCILRCGDGVVASPIECEPARTATCDGACRPIVVMDAGMPDAGRDAGFDAAIAIDGGPDATVEMDGGPDATIEMDGGPDATIEIDGGPDATIELDASTFDASTMDAAISLDASALDASALDASALDASALDATPAADASSDAANVDAANVDAGGTVSSEGCSCRAASRAPAGNAAWILSLGLAAALLRRTRKGRKHA